METAELKTEKSIISIDHTQFGIEESKAAQIAEQFKPMLDKMVELETEYNEVIKLPLDDVMTPFKAKELRLKYVKIRTGTAAIHKTQKEFYLIAGRYVDGWKNAQLFASTGIEEKLQAIENHYENMEKERIAKLKAERVAELTQYEFDGSMLDLGSMTNEIWVNFLSGTKLNFEAKKAETERLAAKAIEDARIEAEERERIRIENEKLKAEAEAREKEIAAERAKAEAERKERESAEQKEKEEREAAERAKQAEHEAELKKEREAKAKIEAELLAKQQAEKAEAEKVEAERKAKELADKKAAKAPKKQKLTTWIEGTVLVAPVGLNDEEVGLNVLVKFEAFKKWAKEQIETI